MIGSISLSLDKKFDMKKAFDSVPHRPLLEKLASIGLHRNILQWVRSYLTDRKQCVVLLGAEASNDIATCPLRSTTRVCFGTFVLSPLYQ